MPLSPTLAAWLVDRGHDAVHAAEVGLAREPDVAIIAHAKREGRTVITVDLDYPRLLTLAQATEPSLILFREGDWSDAAVVARMGGFGSLGDRVAKSNTHAKIDPNIDILDPIAFRGGLERVLADPSIDTAAKQDVRTFLDAWDAQARERHRT